MKISVVFSVLNNIIKNYLFPSMVRSDFTRKRFRFIPVKGLESKHYFEHALGYYNVIP